VLQCVLKVAVCCSVLQCVAVCCNVLQCVAVCALARHFISNRVRPLLSCWLHHTATHCNTLQHTATHCNTLQHTALHCNALHHTATHYTTLQHPATHCNTLQHTATHCNTLHPTATHCTTLQHAGGATLRALMEETATKVWIPAESPPGSSQRTISISGAPLLQHNATHCNKLQHTANTHIGPPNLRLAPRNALFLFQARQFITKRLLHA